MVELADSPARIPNAAWGPAVVFDMDSDWALRVQPGQRKASYQQQLIVWYSAIAATHTAMGVIQLDRDLSRYKAVFAPLQYVLSAKQAANIRKFVEGGGLFVSGFRLGVKDESSQIVRTPLPGLLRDVMGTTLKDYVPIYDDKVTVKFSSPFSGPDGQCGLWADVLSPSTATTLATYVDGRYPGDSAITINAFGKGKAVYLGADLDPLSLARVIGALLGIVSVKALFDVPQGVELAQRKAGSRQWIFVLNHTPASQRIALPGPFQDLLTGGTHNGATDLAPYDVLVLRPA